MSRYVVIQNTADLQQVLDSTVDGDTVDLRNTTWTLTETLRITTAITLIGTATLTEASSLRPMLDVTASATIDGLTFNGVDTVKPWLVEDLDSAAISLSSDGAKVSNCDISGKAQGVRVLGKHCIVERNTITGLLSVKSDGANYHQGISGSSCDDLIAYRNTIKNIGGGITIGLSAVRAIIADNDIEHCFDNGVYLSSGVGCIITANAIKTVDGGGIKARGSSNVINGNVIDEVSMVAIAVTSLPVVDSGSDNRITSNSLTGCGLEGIRVAGVKKDGVWFYPSDTLVDSNTITRVGFAAPGYGSITINGLRHQIINNRVVEVHPSAQAALLLNTTDWVVLVNNTLQGSIKLIDSQNVQQFGNTRENATTHSNRPEI